EGGDAPGEVLLRLVEERPGAVHRGDPRAARPGVTGLGYRRFQPWPRPGQDVLPGLHLADQFLCAEGIDPDELPHGPSPMGWLQAGSQAQQTSGVNALYLLNHSRIQVARKAAGLPLEVITSRTTPEFPHAFACLPRRPRP